MTSASVFPLRPTGGIFLLLVLGLLLSPPSLRAAQGRETLAVSTNEIAAPLIIPKALFADDPQTGRDPFFPDSRRRVRALPPSASNTVAQATSALSQLTLKGISRSKGRPMALINSLTLSPGEKGGIKLGDQKVQVRCLEIRDRSVIVAIEGTKETAELQLRKGM